MKNPFRRKPKVKFYGKNDYKEFVKDYGVGSTIHQKLAEINRYHEGIDFPVGLDWTLKPSKSSILYRQWAGRADRLLNFETLTEYNGVSTEA